MWAFLSSVIEFFILSSTILISSSIITYGDSYFQVISEIQKKKSNTDCYNTCRYSLVVVIETDFI